jgi:hypothetical protein
MWFDFNRESLLCSFTVMFDGNFLLPELQFVKISFFVHLSGLRKSSQKSRFFLSINDIRDEYSKQFFKCALFTVTCIVACHFLIYDSCVSNFIIIFRVLARFPVYTFRSNHRNMNFACNFIVKLIFRKVYQLKKLLMKKVLDYNKLEGK